MSGFISKTMLEEAALHDGFGWLVPVVLLASIFTTAGLIRVLWRVFGPGRSHTQHEIQEAPLWMLGPVAILIAGSILIGILPRFPVENMAWSAANALHQRESYVTAVLEPEKLKANHVEQEHHKPPESTDLTLWGIPLIVLIGGVALAYLTMRPPFSQRNLQNVVNTSRQLIIWTRRWHTGIVSDYALWNAFGTAVMLVILLLARRLG